MRKQGLQFGVVMSLETCQGLKREVVENIEKEQLHNALFPEDQSQVEVPPILDTKDQHDD